MGQPKLRVRLSKMNLDAKFRLYTSILIVAVTFVMLIVSTTFMVCSLYDKSEEAAKSNLSFVAASYGNWLEGNKSILLALQMSPEIQKFCSYTDKYERDYASSRSMVTDLLNNQITSNTEINFISVTNTTLDAYLYRGNHSITNTGYEDANKVGYAESVPAKERGSIKVNFGNDFFGGSKYSITFYQPVYSVKILDKQLGMICMNVNDNLLKSMEDSISIESMQTYLADKEGNLVVSDSSSEYAKEQFQFKGKKRGTIHKNGNYYFFQKIDDWNYYVINAVPVVELYKSSIDVACVMLIIMVVILGLSLAAIRRMVRKNYEQVEEVLKAMDHIANNELSYRIETASMGEDFEKLGKGFNNMIDEINKLMITVRDEQYQIDHIRLQALQSQIQPHFLYNTLECIHWQSMADGNKKVSKLVMALASYYRLSLSKGKDVITLKDELQHIKYYLIIQNQRFGDVIESDIEVDEDLYNVRVPKITLQPLVENAIYHGIRIKDGKTGMVRISACREETGIVIKVESSGEAVSKEMVEQMNCSLDKNDDTFGYGVRNVNRRIELLFGQQYGLEYVQGKQGGVSAYIHLPEEFVKEEESIFGGGHNV